LDEKKRWGLFTLATSAVIALAITVLTVLMPLFIQSVGGIVGLVGVIIWVYGTLTGDVRKLRISVGLTALLFALSLLNQIWMKTVISDFPITLLAFLMILLSLEIVPLITGHRRLHFGDNLGRSENLARVSWKIIGGKISSLGILFSGCYALTMTTIYLGMFIYSLSPIIGDTSIYLVAVFVLLALLVTLREGSLIEHVPHRNLERS